jgi:hypothetical protein
VAHNQATVFRLDDYRPAVVPAPDRTEMLTEGFVILGSLQDYELEAALKDLRARANRRAAP